MRNRCVLRGSERCVLPSVCSRLCGQDSSIDGCVAFRYLLLKLEGEEVKDSRSEAVPESPEGNSQGCIGNKGGQE